MIRPGLGFVHDVYVSIYVSTYTFTYAYKHVYRETDTYIHINRRIHKHMCTYIWYSLGSLPFLLSFSEMNEAST